MFRIFRTRAETREPGRHGPVRTEPAPYELIQHGQARSRRGAPDLRHAPFFADNQAFVYDKCNRDTKHKRLKLRERAEEMRQNVAGARDRLSVTRRARVLSKLALERARLSFTQQFVAHAGGVL